MRPSALRAAFVALALLAAGAASAAPPWADGRSRPEDLRIELLTMGPGDDVPSWWGHSALLVSDTRHRVQRVYNFGMFSFGPDMLVNFLMGRLEFWVGEASAGGTYQAYAARNRAVRVQELNLAPEKRLETARVLADYVLPENRTYLYDHYADNCSTRIRDVIDQAVDGQLEAANAGPARFSLRGHTHRYTDRNPYIDGVLGFWMNDRIDAPIRAWDEMFLPDELERAVDALTYENAAGERVPLVARRAVLHHAVNREPTPEAPPTRWPHYLLLGLALGGAALGLARWERRPGARRLPRVLRGLLHVAVGAAFGFPGLVLVLFPFTEHAITHWNENLLVAGPPMFLALPLGVGIALGSRRAARWSRVVWFVLAAGAVLALVLKVLPAFDQDNWRFLALFLPLNLGFAAAEHLAARRTAARTPRVAAAGERPGTPAEPRRASGA